MDRAIACPLCSQPGFSDVNSLWLTLIRATTRQLTCPICQEILCGLDKLTIHLVSHSLHDQMVQACLAQNLRPLPDPAAFRENQDPSNSNNVSSKEPIQAPEQSEVHNVSAPYVSNNFPTLENNSQLTDFTGPKKLTLSSPTQGVEMSGLSSGKDPPQTGITFPSFLHSKSNDISSESNQPLVMPKNLTSQVTEPAKFGPFSLPMLRDVPQDKIGDKLFITDSTIKSNLNSHPQYVVQQRVHHLESSLETSPLCPPITKLDSIKVMEKCVSKFEGCMISCGMCDLSFKDNNIAMLHQQLVHNIPPNDDNHHQLSTQNDERGHYSKQWSKRSSTASALREAASPLHKYPCHICNKVFRMRGSLMVHLRVGHSPNASTLRHGSSSSHVQPADFTSKLPLQDLTIKEPTLSHPSSEDLLSSGQLNSKTNDHTHVSQIDATEGSRVAQEFALPSFGFSGSASSMCPKLSPTRSPPTASTENTGMIYPCGLCNKTYSKEAFLTQHLKSHDSKQWECDVCYKSFTTKYFLKKHKRLHTGEMPYTCGICNKSFTFQQSYHKHLLYHSDEKPHSCNECGRAFKELSTLHNHQRIHTGEKPWACETCDILCVCA